MRTLILKKKHASNSGQRIYEQKQLVPLFMVTDTIMGVDRGGEEEEQNDILLPHSEDKDFINLTYYQKPPRSTKTLITPRH